MNYIDAICQRHAVRTFNPDKELTAADIHAIEQAINSATSPFGGEVIIKLHHFDIKGPLKPSTYGSVNGAAWFILVGAANNKDSQLSAGYKTAQIALKLFDMGLGTNWMTDTFKNSVFKTSANFPGTAPLLLIMPVGYAAEKSKFLERVTHKILNSSSRKPFNELFYTDNFKASIGKYNIFYKPLEYMRTAPSAYNKQPWRALVDANTIFFYQIPGTASLIGIGIALAIFYFSFIELNHKGEWVSADNIPVHPGWEPIAEFLAQQD